jgi:hypothetical protein
MCAAEPPTVHLRSRLMIEHVLGLLVDPEVGYLIVLNWIGISS